MKVINEMRQRQAWEAQKKSSPLALILGAVIAFGIGLLGVSGIVRVPSLFPPKTQMVPVAPRAAETPAVTIDSSGPRIGRAETAPLLKACVPFAKLGLPREAEPGDLYRLLQSVTSMSRIAAMAGIKQKAIDNAQFAGLWADVADCVYRQNGWVLCDPDNRAFAVEAANTLIRQLSTAAKTEKTGDARGDAGPFGLNASERTYAMQNAGAVKNRVLSGVRAQVAEGRLIASDFGMFAPSEISQIIGETKVTRDACAGQPRGN